jgi:hypothetical protein
MATMHAFRILAPASLTERFVIRPLAELAIAGSGIFLVLFIGLAAQSHDARRAGEVERRPPILKLSIAGDFQQAIHFGYVRDHRDFRQETSLVAPLYVLPVSPHEWLKIETNSPQGLPHSARARIYRSAWPVPCYGGVLIGCIDVDTVSMSHSIPLYTDVDASFGFNAPGTPGPYWIALDADWGFGGRTQVFVIDVRA